MKIAYVGLFLDNKFISGGIGKKISTQLGEWAQAGNEVRLFITSSNVKNFDEAEIFLYGKSSRNIIKNVWSRTIATRKLVKQIEQFSPDIIYLRHALYLPSILKLFRISPVVVELNTLDIIENRERGFARFYYNILARNIVFRYVSGFVSVSKEISTHYSNTKYDKPIRVIGNGIKFDIDQFIPAPNNETPHILFVGTPGMIWHGIDKIMRFANDFPDLNFDIVGYDFHDLPEDVSINKAPKNVKFYGFLKPNQYKKVFEKADIAISSLALHRISVFEISPLKTREYVACGIPTIVPYLDTDLRENEIEGILCIPNTEDNLLNHGNQIRDFAYNMRGKRVDRGLVRQYLDSEIKEIIRLDFFKALL